MIVAYFETPNGSYAEVAGIFSSEEIYIACLPALEKHAKKSRMIVTESCENTTKEIIQIIKKF